MDNPIKDNKRASVIRGGALNIIIRYVQPDSRLFGNKIGIGNNLSFRIVRNR